MDNEIARKFEQMAATINEAAKLLREQQRMVNALYAVFDALYVDEDGTVNTDKEWNPDTLSEVSDALMTVPVFRDAVIGDANKKG